MSEELERFGQHLGGLLRRAAQEVPTPPNPGTIDRLLRRRTLRRWTSWGIVATLGVAAALFVPTYFQESTPENMPTAKKIRPTRTREPICPDTPLRDVEVTLARILNRLGAATVELEKGPGKGISITMVGSSQIPDDGVLDEVSELLQDIDRCSIGFRNGRAWGSVLVEGRRIRP